MQYIYFNTVLLLRAVARIGPYLSAYDYCALGASDSHALEGHDHQEDVDTLGKIAKVVGIASEVGKFDEKALFRGENANVGLSFA